MNGPWQLVYLWQGERHVQLARYQHRHEADADVLKMRVKGWQSWSERVS